RRRPYGARIAHRTPLRRPLRTPSSGLRHLGRSEWRWRARARASPASMRVMMGPRNRTETTIALAIRRVRDEVSPARKRIGIGGARDYRRRKNAHGSEILAAIVIDRDRLVRRRAFAFETDHLRG